MGGVLPRKKWFAMITINDIYIVNGYHPVTPVPQIAIQAGLKHRYAVVIGTYNPAVKYMCFNHAFFIEILSRFAELLDHETMFIEVDDDTEYSSIDSFHQYLLAMPEGDQEPPRRIQFRKSDELTCLEETEFWAFSGGDPPYSDSFTVSFYTKIDKTEPFQAACSAACEKMGVKIKEIIHASDSPLRLSWWSRFLRKL